jgi:hypothetical protein
LQKSLAIVKVVLWLGPISEPGGLALLWDKEVAVKVLGTEKSHIDSVLQWEESGNDSGRHHE